MWNEIVRQILIPGGIGTGIIAGCVAVAVAVVNARRDEGEGKPTPALPPGGATDALVEDLIRRYQAISDSWEKRWEAERARWAEEQMGMQIELAQMRVQIGDLQDRDRDHGHYAVTLLKHIDTGQGPPAPTPPPSIAATILALRSTYESPTNQGVP